ncbi:hypothetical protein HK097_007204 [Rhizophlyctis rosea]|uniref:FAM50A/XAP5 C-terminal domain-containing protein n=1 Tax=Rhizophlyctis rosea TaxID=64517 RepID=A0AAD5X4M3_9FUNG|nr:hypothetical protein HK097_007204 [Rhizophlyctis rosea]
MAEYKGGGAEAARAAMLEKQRNKMMEDFQKQKDQIQKDKAVNIGADKFVAQNDWVDQELKRQTIGLVRLEDFQRIRESLDKKRLEDLEKERATQAKAKRKKKKEKLKLSFGNDEDEDAGESTGMVMFKFHRSLVIHETYLTTELPPPKKIKKDPTVNTSFLPDREREEEERQEREKLQGEWLEQQEKIKRENQLERTMDYWDGTGHRKSVEVTKGNTIAQFLEAVRQQWHELRGVHVDNLMYIKEDLIIPHQYTFYDFIVNKTRGKSGPLFSFDVHDDVRLVNDAAIETEESHAGKVIERAWYEKNKHIFPASRWEVFDPQKDYGKYRIKDKNAEAAP